MGRCATAVQLEGFVSDRLADGELNFVAGHVEECPVCQRVLEQITCSAIANGRSPASTAALPGTARFLELLTARGPCGTVPEQLTPLDRPDWNAAEPGGEPACPTPGSSSLILSSLPVIEGFRIVREVGRGGMGVVYEAEQTRLGRKVALKVLPEGSFPHPKQVQRFEREARVAARLHHTNIVPVFGSGYQDGHHYYIMQYIEGRGVDAVLCELRDSRRGAPSVPPTENLSHFTDGDKLAYRNLAQVGLQVALALDHAHREGVVHRDIKPSNLLLDAKANLWVTDFGLAKTLETDDLTSTGDVVGTLRYMAPERFAGRCDARSDLYSLGLTLYELVALRPAYDAADRFELIEQIRCGPPPSLHKLDSHIPRDLGTIISKLTAPEPAHRYGSAAALADDLRRFLEDRPVQARPASVGERGVRWCRRNPWVAAFLLALSLGAIASTWQTFRATAAVRLARLAETASRDERYRAERSRDRALGAVRKLLETGSYESRADELRPDRESLITASLTEAQALVRELEGDPRAEYQRIETYIALARTQLDAGHAAMALTSAGTAVSLAEERVARDPSSAENRGSLALTLHRLCSLGVTDLCLTAARRSNELCRQLAAQGPENERGQWLTMIAINHYNIGSCDFGKHQFTDAIESFLAAASTCQRLIDPRWHTPEFSYFAAMIQLHLSRLYAREKQPDRALAAGREAVAISQALVVEHPETIEYCQRLNVAYEQLATCYVEMKKPAEAIKCLESSRETLMQMAAKRGGMVGRMARIQALLAQTDQGLCGIYDSDPVRYAEPRRSVATEAFEIADKLSLFQPLVGDLRIIYATQCIDRAEYQEDDGEAADLKAIRKGERLWDTVFRESPADRPARVALVMVRQKLADVLAARGENQEASEWRGRSLTPASGDANVFFDVAVQYARRTGLVGRLPTKLAPRELSVRRERLANHTLAMLREAAAAGFHNGASVRTEPAFASLAGNLEFQSIAADLELPVKAFARP